MHTVKVKSKLACEMVKLEPQKLNEAVHQGHLPCAGETRPGAARIFDLQGLVMLSAFSQLLKLGMNTAAAGQMACIVHRAYDEDLLGRAAQIVVYVDNSAQPPGNYPVRIVDDLGESIFEESEEERMKFSLLFDKIRISFPIREMVYSACSALSYQVSLQPLGED